MILVEAGTGVELRIVMIYLWNKRNNTYAQYSFLKAEYEIFGYISLQEN